MTFPVNTSGSNRELRKQVAEKVQHLSGATRTDCGARYTPAEAIQRACDAIALQKAARHQMLRVEARARRREFIRQFSGDYHLLTAWLSEVAPRRFLQTDEAVRWLAGEVKRQRSLDRLRHWAFQPHHLAACAERLVLARFYRRFGLRIWQRRAA